MTCCGEAMREPKVKNLSLMDTDTGEVLEQPGLPVIFAQRTRCGFEEWMSLNQKALLELSKKPISGVTARVLFAMLARLDYENNVLVPMVALAGELGLHPANLRRAIKDLEERGLLLRGPKVGNTPSFRLSPDFGWKGRGSNHRKALEEYRLAQVISLVPEKEGAK